MKIKTCELLNTDPETPEHGGLQTFTYVILLILPCILVYLFIRHGTPKYSTAVCDLIKQGYNAAGGSA